MKVELVDKMGDDLSVSNVARVSFNKWKDSLDDKDVKLIDYLAKHEHTSPFRHVFLSLRCSAPIFLARQLMKHQVGLSWNEVSRRYVDTPPDFYYPDAWRKRPEGGIKQGSGEEFDPVLYEEYSDVDIESKSINVYPEITCSEGYNNVVSMCLELYEKMIEKGVAPEMARMVLPQSMMTEWIWSGSLQAFFHVWRLRSKPDAQMEAQMFAVMLDENIGREFPLCWEALRNAI